ncbi:MAG: hypothetical protein JNM89_00035 [Hyphomicrobiaceae bacterium]|nr:hypothetical protein [Hyphomicrobiaceae bacterium]
MPEIYQSGPNGLWVFLLLTVAIGGGAAWVTGKAIAETWRPVSQLVVYVLLIAAGVRFFHYALFEEPLLAAANFLVDAAVLLAAALAGFRVARARQMARQYGWLTASRGERA